MLVFVLIYAVVVSLSILAGLYARSKGRSELGYFFLSVVMSPIIGFIVLAILRPIPQNVSAKPKAIAVFLVPLSLFVLIGAFLLYGLKLDPRRIPSPLIDKPLPAFSLPTLDNPDKIMTNADLRGHVVMVNVWASWCVACKEEHPVLVDLAARKQVTIIGLNYKDARADALGVLRSKGDPYNTVLVDASGRTGIDWGVYGVPESFIVDKQGIIRYKQIGPITPDVWDKTLWPLIQRLS